MSQSMAFFMAPPPGRKNLRIKEAMWGIGDQTQQRQTPQGPIGGHGAKNQMEDGVRVFIPACEGACGRRIVKPTGSAPCVTNGAQQGKCRSTGGAAAAAASSKERGNKLLRHINTPTGNALPEDIDGAIVSFVRTQRPRTQTGARTARDTVSCHPLGC